MQLTPRQQREIAYHVSHAEALRAQHRSRSHEVIVNPRRKWWNHYWVAYSILKKTDLRGKNVLVPGCGDGIDAIRLAKLDANVRAFDLSPDMLRLAEEHATEEGLTIEFSIMPAERLSYANDTFDVIFIRDLLHHCELPMCMSELRRVAKPGAFILIDELYTYSAVQRLRESGVGRWLYPKVVNHIYHGEDPYITEDEQKLNDADVAVIRNALSGVRCRYFNIIVNRFIPDWDAAEMVDRVMLSALGRAGGWFAGRFIMTGFVRK